ncbi:hypothetical protein MRX96_043036 [Rhipicephalus microplus]
MLNGAHMRGERGVVPPPPPARRGLARTSGVLAATLNLREAGVASSERVGSGARASVLASLTHVRCGERA